MSYLRFSRAEYEALADLCRGLDLQALPPDAFRRALVRSLPGALAARVAGFTEGQLRVLAEHLGAGSGAGGGPYLSGEEFEAFRGLLGIQVIQCRPRDPEAKGLVERANGYFETSFLPGRSFTSPGDFNTQLASWLVRANDRHHRAIGCRPSQRIHADQQAMLPLPPVDPLIGWRMSVRLPRDYYVRLDSNDYSVHPSVVGRRVEVVADLTRVSVLCAGRLVAEHERCWARHQSITDPEHRAAADTLRTAHHSGNRPDRCEPVEQRSLNDYDTAFGLDDGAVA